VCSINDESIVVSDILIHLQQVLGGIKRKDSEQMPKDARKVFALENRVAVLRVKSEKWKELKPLPFRKKISNVVHNGNGRLFCFVVENNRELPQLFVYDVRTSFPQYDKYWMHEEE